MHLKAVLEMLSWWLLKIVPYSVVYDADYVGLQPAGSDQHKDWMNAVLHIFH